VNKLDGVLAEFRQYLTPAPNRLAIFDYLWEHQVEKVTAGQLWENVLQKRNLSLSDAPPDEFDSEGNTRQLCTELRKSLIRFFTPERCWHWQYHIELPKSSRHMPYQLKVTPLTDSPTMAFWRPHVDENNVTLVYSQPIFYWDIQQEGYIRFLNTNAHSGTYDEAFDELESRHGDEMRKWYGETPARKRLRPGRVFVGMGEMAAMDMLAEWFHRWPWLKVEKKPNEAVPAFRGISPVLLGSQRISKHIYTLLNSPAGQQFRYRLHDTRIGYGVVRNAKREEKPILEQFAKDVVKLPLQENGDTVIPVSPMALTAERTRLAILTRIAKSGNSGTVTMISSDTTLGIQEVARALTTEEYRTDGEKPLVTEILEAFGWPKHPLPAAFEVLFSVEIARHGVDDEAEIPRLLVASPCGK
jgi:hypothetical protein